MIISINIEFNFDDITTKCFNIDFKLINTF